MEFLRFGSSIPGGYWGCCACCIIQNFNFDPDAKTSIQMVNGDGGHPMQKYVDGKAEPLFAGPTYRDVFWQRIRVGTFGGGDMPNHAFLAILTRDQLNSKTGKQWLGILKEAGFEFIRTVSNSVYAGPGLLEKEKPTDNSPNYIFGMFRNIGTGAITDPFTPPKEWTDLPSVVPEAWSFVKMAADAMGDYNTSDPFGTLQGIADGAREAQRAIWDIHPMTPLLTEAEVVKAGAPVIMAGLRSKFPQQPKTVRDSLLEADKKAKPAAAAGSLFPVALG